MNYVPIYLNELDFSGAYAISLIKMSVCSMCKVLENRAQQDEERMDQLTNQLKEARLLAEDADGKSDEVKMINYYISPYILIHKVMSYFDHNFLMSLCHKKSIMLFVLSILSVIIIIVLNLLHDSLLATTAATPA